MADMVHISNIHLSVVISEELRDKYGIDRWKSGEIFSNDFTIDDLSKITSLKFNTPQKGCCKDLYLLPNLNTLVLDGGSHPYEYSLPKNISSIGDEDIWAIEKCKNLQNLSIVNQTNISDIDLSKMPKLGFLDISRNANLKTITGIDKLPELDAITCYGNKSLQEIKGLDKVIANGKLYCLELDVLLFPQAVGYRRDGSYNQKAADEMENMVGTVKWSEALRNKKITINHHQMLWMHNKACGILADNVPKNAGTMDTVIAVERYLAENVTYDHDSLKYARTKSKEICLNGEKIRMVTGVKNGINGAYDCIMENSCVCEGFTRGEQYLLALKGIKTSNVHCIAGADTIGMADSKKDFSDVSFMYLPRDGYHSIIRIDDYYGLYSDPCWNASCYRVGKGMPYSLLTKKEISETHTLSFEERDIANDHLAIERTCIANSLKYNKLFAQTTNSEVSAQRKSFRERRILQGMVLGKNGVPYV